MSTLKKDKFFTRVLEILNTLADNNYSMHVDELAEEFGVHKRTIYRDLGRLHFFPIECINGVVYLQEDYEIESPDIDNEELLVAELAFSAIHGLDEQTDKRLHSLRAKMTNPLFFNPYKIKAEGFESINKDSALLNKIEDAITKKNFSKVKSNDIISDVEPYKVVAFDGIWYLLAKDLEDKKLKTYLISHIQEFRASAQVFANEHRDINKMLENVHTAWYEDGNSFSVKVKIKKEIAPYFKLKKHLSSQKIVKENKDGSLIVTFDVSCDEDVDNLIKAWLPHVEVISPTRFRKRLIQELEEYVKGLKSLQV